MEKLELDIVALSHRITQSQSYAVVLSEKNGVRRLPIVIGTYEAQAIAMATENMVPTRPLTHDLLKNLCVEFGIEIKEIIISNLQSGIFYATLICQNADGNVLEIDSRTSDALALAVRFGCPIYTYEFILEQAGIVLEESDREKVRTSKSARPSDLSRHSIEKLTDMLNEALSHEDYEKAAQLRDEIQKRS